MFDQKPGLGVNNNNQGSQPSMPTPPPMRRATDVIASAQGAEVEDIFSPVSSAEEVVRNNNLNPSVSSENRGVGAGLNPQKTQSSGGKKAMIMILVVILIALIGGGVWYYLTYMMTPTEIVDNINAPVLDETETTEETVNTNINTNINSNVNTENNQLINENINTPNIPSGIILEDDLDSDADGLLDSQEISMGTDSLNPDSDSDGLFDGEEINIYKTNPMNPDSDGDGYSDGDEIKGGYNPNGPGVLQAITR